MIRTTYNDLILPVLIHCMQGYNYIHGVYSMYACIYMYIYVRVYMCTYS